MKVGFVKAEEGLQRTDVAVDLKIGHYNTRSPEGGRYVGIFRKK